MHARKSEQTQSGTHDEAKSNVPPSQDSNLATSQPRNVALSDHLTTRPRGCAIGCADEMPRHICVADVAAVRPATTCGNAPGSRKPVAVTQHPRAFRRDTQERRQQWRASLTITTLISDNTYTHNMPITECISGACVPHFHTPPRT